MSAALLTNVCAAQSPDYTEASGQPCYPKVSKVVEGHHDYCLVTNAQC